MMIFQNLLDSWQPYPSMQKYCGSIHCSGPMADKHCATISPLQVQKGGHFLEAYQKCCPVFEARRPTRTPSGASSMQSGDPSSSIMLVCGGLCTVHMYLVCASSRLC